MVDKPEAQQAAIKRCPVCGIMMVATRRDLQRPDPDYYECFKCGAVFSRSAGNGRAPGSTS